MRYPVNVNYITHVQSDINFAMRSILCDWMVEVVEEYSMQQQTLYLAINYVDRYLSTQFVKREKLQLLGVACMLVAAKYEEIFPPAVDDFVYIADNTYTRAEVCNVRCRFWFKAPCICLCDHLLSFPN
jgi:cyclin A